MGLAAGVLVGTGKPELAAAIAVAIPVCALVLHYPFAGVIVWLLAMPFAGVSSSGPEAGPVLWAVHRIGIPGLLLLAVSYHLLGLRRAPIRLGPLDAAIALFIGFGIVNVLIFSPQPVKFLVSFYDKLAVPLMFFWLIRLLAPDRRDLRLLVPVAVWTIAVQGTVGVLSWVAPAILPAAWLGRVGERTVGTLGGPGPYTIGIVFFALFLAYSITFGRRSYSTATLAVVVGAAIVAVFLSLSRGSWLGATLAFAGLTLVLPRFVVGFGLVAILVVALISLGPLGVPISRVADRLNEADTVGARVITNDAAIRMIGDRPLQGFGYGNFDRFDEQYKRPVGDIPLNLGGTAHNTYLNLAVEMGVPAALAYMAVPAWLLVMTVRLRKSLRLRRETWLLVLILWLALLDQFVVSNFAEMVQSSGVWATSLWWMTLGLIATGLERTRADRNSY